MAKKAGKRTVSGSVKRRSGRPTKMTTETVKKLEAAFSYAMSDEEACMYAGITKPTLYDYCEKNMEFKERKELLKGHPTMAAKRNVVDAINKGDVKMSQWWLERKARSEFALRNEHTGADDDPIQFVFQNSDGTEQILGIDKPAAPQTTQRQKVEQKLEWLKTQNSP